MVGYDIAYKIEFKEIYFVNKLSRRCLHPKCARAIRQERVFYFMCVKYHECISCSMAMTISLILTSNARLI